MKYIWDFALVNQPHIEHLVAKPHSCEVWSEYGKISDAVCFL